MQTRQKLKLYNKGIYKYEDLLKEDINENTKKIIEYEIYNKEPILGCSAEGHISHDLASRMTTICRGWSISNANKMSKLRAFRNNNGDFYELIKANHKWLKKERKNVIIIRPRKETMKYISTKTKITTDIVGKYYDLMQATIDQEIRTKYNLNY